MKMMGQDLSEEEIQEILDSLDINKNGKLDIDEFIAFMVEK